MTGSEQGFRIASLHLAGLVNLYCFYKRIYNQTMLHKGG